MAYEVPTIGDFRRRFPEFDAVDDELLDLLLEESKLNVDESWGERDYPLAILYLTAHLVAAWEVARDRQESSQSSGGVSNAETYVRSVSFGDRTVSYGLAHRISDQSSAAVATSLETTPYGQMFALIRARNARYIAVI